MICVANPNIVHLAAQDPERKVASDVSIDTGVAVQATGRSIKFSIDYLRGTANRPEIRSLKHRSYELMQIGLGANVIDIGCGPGMDTIELAKRVGPGGRVVGIDTDPEMVAAAIAAAAEAGVEGWSRHCVGSSLLIPFEDATFDACRCERVLQHLSWSDGQRTVCEARRVIRSGGRIVFIDTDWSTLSIHSHNSSFERRLARLRRSTLKNPFAARALKELFMNAGIEVLHVEASPIYLSLERIDLLFSDICRRERLSQKEWQTWRDDLAAIEEHGAFFASLCMVTCCGTAEK